MMSRTADAEYRLYSSPPLLIGLSQEVADDRTERTRQDERCPERECEKTSSLRQVVIVFQ